MTCEVRDECSLNGLDPMPEGGAAVSAVTKNQFFAALYADSRDIMPLIVSDSYPYETEWRTNPDRRELFGRSRDGAYWLVEFEVQS